MAEKRRYTKRQKAGAVTAALASSVSAAADQTGVPESTLRYWMESPEFEEIRTKTREDLAQESKALAHVALDHIRQRIGEFEPKDLAVLFGILTDKAQLLSGAATARTEHRELLNDFGDGEKEAVEAWLHDLARERLNAG